MSSRVRQMIEAVEEEAEKDGVDVSIPPAKKPAQVYSVRIPIDRIEELKALAAARGTRPSTLIRHIVERELDNARPSVRGDEWIRSVAPGPLQTLSGMWVFASSESVAKSWNMDSLLQRRRLEQAGSR